MRNVYGPAFTLTRAIGQKISVNRAGKQRKISCKNMWCRASGKFRHTPKIPCMSHAHLDSIWHTLNQKISAHINRPVYQDEIMRSIERMLPNITQKITLKIAIFHVDSVPGWFRYTYTIKSNDTDICLFRSKCLPSTILSYGHSYNKFHTTEHCLRNLYQTIVMRCKERFPQYDFRWTLACQASDNLTLPQYLAGRHIFMEIAPKHSTLGDLLRDLQVRPLRTLKCPICSHVNTVPPSPMKLFGQDVDCVVCTDAKISTYLPCGHACLCDACYALLLVTM